MLKDTRLFYDCISYDEYDELFLNWKKWKCHENIHFQIELWRYYFCSKFIFFSITFRTHLKNTHKISETTIAKKLISNHIERNYQESFWCSFCDKIEIHYLKDLDAHNKRLNHMKWHFEKRNDNLKNVYSKKKWIVRHRNECQIINLTNVCLFLTFSWTLD